MRRAAVRKPGTGTVSPWKVGDTNGWLTITDTAHGLGSEPKRLWFICSCKCGGTAQIVSHAMKRRTSCGCGGERDRRNQQACLKRRLPGDLAARRSTYGMYRNAAKDRHLEFSVSFEEFSELIDKACAYCGSPPVLHKRPRNIGGDIVRNGVDRVVNAVGYVTGNCVPCCKICNRMKLNLSEQEFLDHIRRIHEHRLHATGSDRG